MEGRGGGGAVLVVVKTKQLLGKVGAEPLHGNLCVLLHRTFILHFERADLMSVSKTVQVDGTRYLVHDDGKTELIPEYYGKSTDQKPVDGVKNASVFYEMDTKKVFMFDADADTGSDPWLEQ